MITSKCYKGTCSFSYLLNLYKRNRFHFAVHLFSYNIIHYIGFGENISDHYNRQELFCSYYILMSNWLC